MGDFCKSVYEVVAGIPRGKVMTYKGVAVRLGRPKAARAVGIALSRNRDSAIPCHRVIRSDRRIGGYAFGAPRKKRILMQEGVLCGDGVVPDKYVVS